MGRYIHKGFFEGIPFLERVAVFLHFSACKTDAKYQKRYISKIVTGRLHYPGNKLSNITFSKL